MQKVLIVTNASSFIKHFCMENIKLLKRMGFEVHVASNFRHDSNFDKKANSCLKNDLQKLDVKYYQIDFSRNEKNLLSHFKSYKQLLQIVSENKYEFIHCNNPISGIISRLVSLKLKVKIIYTAHGFHFYKGAPIKNWILFYPIEKICSKFTDVLITINKEDYQLAKKKFNAKRTVYIPGIGIDVSRFQNILVDKVVLKKELGIPTESFILLSVGELNENKNHSVVIKALSELGIKDVHYIIAGVGPLKNELERLSLNKNVGYQVHFLGYRTDIDKIYHISDVFVFPSYREGLSVALMEAMASGLPCVVSDIRGNTDLIDDGKGGFLCKPNDVNGFAKNIKNIILDKERINIFRKYNQEKVKNFNISSVLKMYIEIYKNIVG